MDRFLKVVVSDVGLDCNIVSKVFFGIFLIISAYFRVSALKSKRAIAGVLCVDTEKNLVDSYFIITTTDISILY